MRIARRILIGLVVVVGCIAALSTPSPSATALQGFTPPNSGTWISPFQCYQATGSSPNRVVALADQFDNSTAVVGKPFAFCDNASARGVCGFENDNDTYPLTAYLIKDTPTTPLLHPVVRVRSFNLANNPFGCFFPFGPPSPFTQDLQIVAPHSILVPTQKELYPLAQNNPEVNDNITNHFKCYTVRTMDNSTGPFRPGGIDNLTGQSVRFTDQFIAQQVRFLKSLYLCTPVDKNNGQPSVDRINTPFDHLLCGSFRPTVSFRSRFVQGYNQFFPNGQRLQLRSPTFGCIPVNKECFGRGCFRLPNQP
jgi:hypothetical protein